MIRDRSADTGCSGASGSHNVDPIHQLVPPNSIRSQALELHLPRVRGGELSEPAALELHERITEIKLRLLGDRFLAVPLGNWLWSTIGTPCMRPSTSRWPSSRRMRSLPTIPGWQGWPMAYRWRHSRICSLLDGAGPPDHACRQAVARERLEQQTPVQLSSGRLVAVLFTWD